MSERGIRLSDKSLNFVKGSLRPLRDQLIIKPLPPHLSQTLVAHWNGEAVRGEVLAAGPGAYPNIHTRFFKDGKEVRQVRQSTQFRPTEVRIGDIVQLGGMELGGYLWPHIMVDGEDCIICTEKDVTFIEAEYDANTPQSS